METNIEGSVSREDVQGGVSPEISPTVRAEPEDASRGEKLGCPLLYTVGWGTNSHQLGWSVPSSCPPCAKQQGLLSTDPNGTFGQKRPGILL